MKNKNKMDYSSLHWTGDGQKAFLEYTKDTRLKQGSLNTRACCSVLQKPNYQDSKYILKI